MSHLVLIRIFHFVIHWGPVGSVYLNVGRQMSLGVLVMKCFTDLRWAPDVTGPLLLMGPVH